MATEKISLYNLADLKNTTDDALPNYLNSLKFKQSHFLTDVRLALGYSAFVIAAACFGWDYQFGFDNTKYYTAGAVAIYALLNGFLTFWLSMVEKGTVYQGTAPSGERVTIRTSTKKNDPTYYVTVISEHKTGEPQSIQISRPFSSWFDETGRFVAKPFQEFLATSVPAIGKQDPKKAKSSLPDVYSANAEVLDAILAGTGATGNATGADATETKSKRRKA
ncbi:Signal peptidase complex subunit 2 [Metarhizium rileyi]|uniref:Signal peptidase complex subunit 2 n=1 Tax=Metarhizium rileyi (strain RCEF 4871) TaxID=1649241 RepID=A0A167A7G4_METRR|nr:Signal peptidase complex subunit 2 [Metarhizium rileyi RCEF 4871]TWU73504.1 hypothetical protein ED733_001847 [Metarhizium rileyi]